MASDYELAKAYIQIVPTTKDFKSTLSSAIDSDISSSAKSAGSAWSTAFGVVAAKAITALTNEVKELCEEIINVGMEAEDAFAQLETIAGSDNIDSLSESLSELAEQTGISSSELALTAYNAISAGTSAENAAEMVEAAAKLATAGFTDTDSALSVLTTTINAYGLAEEEASAISDSLIQVQNLGVTTIDELASSMGKAISTASAYNVDLYNLESAYVSLTKAGISTEESTTYLSSMLNELGDTSSDVAAVIEDETGKSFSELMEEGYSLGDVMSILYEACDEDSTALMNLWSSAEAGKASNAIVSQGLEEFNENLESIQDSAGATEEAYSIMTDTLSYKTDVLSATGENLMTALYNGMSGSLGTIVDFASDAISTLTDAFEDGGIDGMMDVIPDLVSEGIDMIMDFLPDIIDVAGELILGFAEGLLDSLPDIIDAIMEIGVSLIEKIGDMLPDLLTAILEAIPSIVATLISSIPDILAAIVKGLAQILVSIAEWIDGLMVSLGDWLDNIISSVVSWFSNLWNTVVEWYTSMQAKQLEWFSEVWNSIKEWFTNLISGIAEWFTNIFNSIVEWYTSMQASQTEWFANIWNSIKEWFSNLISGVVETFTSIKDKIMSIWTSINEGLANIISTIVTSTKEKFTNIKDTIINVFTTVKTKIKAIWNAIWTTMKNIINKILAGVESFVNGVISGINSLLSGINKMVNAVGSAINKLFGTEIGEISLQISKVSLPRLATGAVIPPNDEFLAVLGDQTSGRNIEAPESLLREIVAEESVYADINTEDGISDRLDRLEDFLGECFSALLNKDATLVLDTGELVGATAERYNKALATLATKQARG